MDSLQSNVPEGVANHLRDAFAEHRAIAAFLRPVQNLIECMQGHDPPHREERNMPTEEEMPTMDRCMASPLAVCYIAYDLKQRVGKGPSEWLAATNPIGLPQVGSCLFEPY